MIPERVALPWTSHLAEELVALLLEDGLGLREVVEILGEAFRIAGERAIERRHLGTHTA